MTTAAGLKWGTMWTVNAGASGLYGGVAPYLFESGTTGNHGFGVRMHARKYENSPATIFATSVSADVVAHNRGVKILGSVSNQDKIHSGFTWDKATNGVSAGVGTWDSDWTAFFGRMAASGGTSVGVKLSQAVDTTGSNLLGSYGGITEPNYELIIEHEVDRPDKTKFGNATNFKGYFRHVHNLMVTAGVRNKFLLNFCITEFGLNTRLATVNSFYPGADVVDVLGVDFYGDFTNTWAYDGSTKPFATAMAPTFAWVRGYNKPFNFPEFQEAESSNDTDMTTWFTGIGTTLALSANSDLNCTGIYLWCQASSKYQNFNKLVGDAGPSPNVAHLGKHNGVIASMGTYNNPVIGSAASLPPAAPTNISAVSNTAGTQLTITVDTAPTITPAITGERIYLGDGVTTNLHRQDAAAGQPDHAVTTTYTITGLTPGATYSYSWSWANSAGNSGFAVGTDGNVRSITMSIPGSGSNAPNITSPPAVTQDTTDTLEYDYSVGAVDPHSLPLSYAWTFTSPSGQIVTAPGASGTTPELTELGSWTASVAVTNTTPLTTPASTSFAVTAPGSTAVTKYFLWPKPITGDPVRTVGPKLRNFMDGVDLELRKRVYHKSNQNLSQGLVASAYDKAAMHSTNTQALTSGWAYWTSFVAEDDHFDEIWFVTKGTIQIGSGTLLAVYDSTGQILPNGVYSGTNVDNAFKAAAGANAYSLALDSITPEVLIPGNLYYGLVKNSGATQVPTLVVSGTPSTAANLGDFGAAQPSFGGWNLGAGTLPSTIPWASATLQFNIWLGLGASDVSTTT